MKRSFTLTSSLSKIPNRGLNFVSSHPSLQLTERIRGLAGIFFGLELWKVLLLIQFSFFLSFATFRLSSYERFLIRRGLPWTSKNNFQYLYVFIVSPPIDARWSLSRKTNQLSSISSRSILCLYNGIIQISRVCYARLLGITIDHKLTLAEHLADLKNSFVIKLNLLKRVLFSKKKVSPAVIFVSDPPFCALWNHHLGKLTKFGPCKISTSATLQSRKADL